jgi:hypothetical protein
MLMNREKKLKVILKSAFVVASLATFISGPANGQWLPRSNEPAFLNLQYAPLCNSKREQIRVKLNKSTNFLIMDNLNEGDVLYGVKFSLQSNNKPRFEGAAYCKPHIAKELGFFASYNAKQANQRGIRLGFELCMYDFNSDGIFDDANYNAWYFKVEPGQTYSDQFPYSVIEEGGEMVPSCPRPTSTAKALSIGQHIWDALTEIERGEIKLKRELDIIPVQEAGTLLQVERIDDSTAGTTSGARLGEAAAGANYIDNSVNSGHYSATNQLGAQVVGAAIGSILDSTAKTIIRTRYSVRSLGGSIVTSDKTSYSKGFTLPVGTCVALPTIEQLDQSICEITLSAFRAQYFPLNTKTVSETTLSSVSTKERRLRELKELFDRGLVTEKVYADQQNRILAD